MSPIYCDGARSLGETVLLLAHYLRLYALCNGHDVAVECQDLGHEINDLETIVRLLSERVSKQIQLSHERKLGEREQEPIQVTQLVVATKQNIQEFKTL